MTSARSSRSSSCKYPQPPIMWPCYSDEITDAAQSIDPLINLEQVRTNPHLSAARLGRLECTNVTSNDWQKMQDWNNHGRHMSQEYREVVEKEKQLQLEVPAYSQRLMSPASPSKRTSARASPVKPPPQRGSRGKGGMASLI